MMHQNLLIKLDNCSMGYKQSKIIHFIDNVYQKPNVTSA